MAVAALTLLTFAAGACADDGEVGGDRSDRVEGEMPNDADDPDTGPGGADGSGDGEGIGGAGGGAGDSSDSE